MNFSINNIHKFFVDFVLLMVASYFVIRKTTNFSGSGLPEGIFQPDAGGKIVEFLTYVVAYALAARLVIYCKDYFKVIDAPSLGFPHYRCLLNNNKEIEKHLNELREDCFSLDKMDERHSYEENIQIIHRNFSEHLTSALKEKKIGMSDIFMSLFHDKDFNFEFENRKIFDYSSHYDPTLYDTGTSQIDIGNSSYKDFAGVRAIKRKSPVICHKIGSNNYDIGKEERRQSIKHYLGVPLKINGSVVGLLNIEFHNKSIFSSAKEMKTFYQKEVQAFTYLYEYQLHKKYFFKHLNEQVVNS